MEKLSLEVKTFEGWNFYFADIGKEIHGRPSFRLWVSPYLVKKDADGNPFIELPLADAKIVRTEKGTIVLRRVEGWKVFRVGIPCGYRGESWFRILEPAVEDSDVFVYKVYNSELGSLGVSVYALVNTKADKVKIEWERTGRLYGDAPRGATVYYIDGRVESLEHLQDGLEDLEQSLGGAE
jgi:hypothetical protein